MFRAVVLVANTFSPPLMPSLLIPSGTLDETVRDRQETWERQAVSNECEMTPALNVSCAWSRMLIRRGVQIMIRNAPQFVRGPIHVPQLTTPYQFLKLSLSLQESLTSYDDSVIDFPATAFSPGAGVTNFFVVPICSSPFAPLRR